MCGGQAQWAVGLEEQVVDCSLSYYLARKRIFSGKMILLVIYTSESIRLNIVKAHSHDYFAGIISQALCISGTKVLLHTRQSGQTEREQISYHRT